MSLNRAAWIGCQSYGFISLGANAGDFEQAIRKDFEENPPLSVNECRIRIEKLCGIKRGRAQIGRFVRDMGSGYRKIAGIPGKAVSEVKKRAKRVPGGKAPAPPE